MNAAPGPASANTSQATLPQAMLTSSTHSSQTYLAVESTLAEHDGAAPSSHHPDRLQPAASPSASQSDEAADAEADLGSGPSDASSNGLPASESPEEAPLDEQQPARHAKQAAHMAGFQFNGCQFPQLSDGAPLTLCLEAPEGNLIPTKCVSAFTLPNKEALSRSVLPVWSLSSWRLHSEASPLAISVKNADTLLCQGSQHGAGFQGPFLTAQCMPMSSDQPWISCCVTKNGLQQFDIPFRGSQPA